MEKATVIIPCYNVEAYIQECLDSVALQGEVVHHTFVVDNNSTDNTIEKIREWQDAHSNFPMTVLSESRPGAPAARNCPLHRIETKWIQFLDADDLLSPGKVGDQIHQYPSADVICTAAKHLATDGTERTLFPQSNITLGLIKGEAGITSANLFSTASIQAVKGWGESLKSSQEYDLMFRIWQTGAAFEVDLTPRAVIRERHSGQISQRDPVEKWIQLVHLRERMLVDFSAGPRVDECLKTDLYQSFFDQLRNLAKYDLEAALSSYSRVLEPIRFFPRRNDTTTSTYLLCFRVLGFEYTERVKRVLKP